MRPHLKLQQELFLSFLLDRLILPPSIAPGARKADVETALDRSTWLKDEGEDRRPSSASTVSRERERDREKGPSAETRELMLEIISHFARGKYPMVDLWVNYDCNVEGEDLFERLIKFLSRVSLCRCVSCKLKLTSACCGSRAFILRTTLHPTSKTRSSFSASRLFSSSSGKWLRAWTRYIAAVLLCTPRGFAADYCFPRSLRTQACRQHWPRTSHDRRRTSKSSLRELRLSTSSQKSASSFSKSTASSRKNLRASPSSSRRRRNSIRSFSETSSRDRIRSKSSRLSCSQWTSAE